MLRFSIVRRLLKCWNKYYTSKRDRTPSSLQECLDPPPPKRGLWRNWFIPLIIIPILYYFFIIRGDSKYEEYSVLVTEKAPRPEQRSKQKEGQQLQEALLHLHYKLKQGEATNEPKPMEEPKNPEASGRPDFPKPSYYQIQRPKTRYSQEIMDFHEHPPSSKKIYSIENGTLIAKLDESSNNTILARPVPLRHEKIKTTKSGGKSKIYWPMCIPKLGKLRNVRTDVTSPKNLTTEIIYRNMLQKGGLYSPKNCQPRHKVAVLVAYRNRPTNLAAFLFHIHPFLIEQALEYRIFVVEQQGDELFNRGRLFNAGFIEAQKYGDWGCLVFHDVDLLPADRKIMYSCPTWPRHMSATILGKKAGPYFQSFFGGVTSMTLKHFASVNGYSNLYWGWGGEDNDMFWRIKISGLPIVRYSKSIAKYIPLPHEKSPENPIRKLLVRNIKERYKTDGLSNFEYKLVSVTLYRTYTHFLVDVNPTHENLTELFRKYSR